MEETVVLLVGTFVSFVVSVLAIKFLLSYLKKNDFTAFGWYRIILGIILIGYWFYCNVEKTRTLLLFEKCSGFYFL